LLLSFGGAEEQKMIARLLLVSAALFVISLAWSSASTRNEASETDNVEALYNECNGQVEDKLYCTGFIFGVFSQMRYNRYFRYEFNDSRDSAIMAKLFSVCSPTDVSNAAMVHAFVDWAKRHRESWTLDQQLGVMYALREAWPCPP
jgi:Rap1a immunity proteins